MNQPCKYVLSMFELVHFTAFESIVHSLILVNQIWSLIHDENKSTFYSKTVKRIRYWVNYNARLYEVSKMRCQ